MSIWWIVSLALVAWCVVSVPVSLVLGRVIAGSRHSLHETAPLDRSPLLEVAA